jgi:hypothetical protein
MQGPGAGDVEQRGARGQFPRAVEIADGGGDPAGRLELERGRGFAGGGQRAAEESGGGIDVVFVDRDLGGGGGGALRPFREQGERGRVVPAGEGESRPLFQQPDLLAVALGHPVDQEFGVVEPAAGAGDADDGPNQLDRQPVARRHGERDRLVGQLFVAQPVRVRSAIVVHGSTQVACSSAQ